MKRFLSLFGNIYLALFLLLTAVVMVSLGTWIESRTDSHLQASRWIYTHPLFKALLILFFINILFASLTRFPFKKKHIPFLITHLGLLLVIAGTFIKITWGLQGQLFITEGSSSDQVFLDQRYALTLQPKEGTPLTFPLKRGIDAKFHLSANPKIKLIHQLPHTHTFHSGWIVEDSVRIFGLPEFALDHTRPLPKASLIAPLPFEKNLTEWHYYALRSDSLLPVLEGLFKRHCTTPDAHLTLLVDTHYQVTFQATKPHKVEIDPFVVIAQIPQLGTLLTFCNSQGTFTLLPFPKETLPTLVAFDKGHQGLAIQATVPEASLFPTPIKKQVLNQLETLSNDSPLPSFVRLFKNKTQEAFPEQWSALLEEWDKTKQWLYPRKRKLPPSLAQTMENFPWEQIPIEEHTTALWISTFLSQMGTPQKNSFENTHWPFTKEYSHCWKEDGTLRPDKEDTFYQLLTEHLYTVSHSFPPSHIEAHTPEEHFHYLTALLQLHKIHLRHLPPEESRRPVELLTPLFTHTKPLSPLPKWEENIPALLLELSEGETKEQCLAVLDPLASEIPLPVLNGKYLLRFQLESQKIPYKVRLHDCRQINYFNSQKVYSYESDLSLTGGELPTTHTTISMNHVFETPKRFRFYMASLFPPEESRAQRVQLTVNYDPVKYTLTYPGTILLVIGILCLLWFQPYARKK